MFFEKKCEILVFSDKKNDRFLMSPVMVIVSRALRHAFRINKTCTGRNIFVSRFAPDPLTYPTRFFCSREEEPQTRGARRDVTEGGENVPVHLFHSRGDAVLEDCLTLVEGSEQIPDFTMSSDGVLNIEIGKDRPNIVLNKHAGTKQIWYSSPEGAQYFSYPYNELVAALKKDLNTLGIEDV